MLIALVTATLFTAPCEIEHARYALRTMPAVTARFDPVPGDADWREGIALRIDFAATGRSYWWLPWNGGTDGRQHLASAPDPATPGWAPMAKRPLGDVDFLATGADYALLERVPRRGDIAPAHFLIPDLREAMWYRTPQDKREGTAKQFFDLVSCDRAG
jgi:hypothetical protein